MQFTVWLTYNCNLECNYCYEGKNKACKNMNLDIATKTLEFIRKQIKQEQGAKKDFTSIVFHGGEPLLNLDIMKYMIKNIKSWEMDVPIYLSTTTNAILLTNDTINYLTNNLNELSISLDGIKEAHDSNRRFANGIGSYDFIIRNVKNLLLFGNVECNIRVRMTVTPSTIMYIYDSLAFLVELGFTNIMPVMDNFTNWSYEDMELLYREIVRFYEDIYLRRGNLFVGLIENISMRQKSFCLAGDETMHISPEGVLFPCAYVMNYDNLILGSVEEGIHEEAVRKLRMINGLELINCQTCAWENLCMASRCKLLNYAITGDYYKPAISTCLNEHLLLKIHQYRNKN